MMIDVYMFLMCRQSVLIAVLVKLGALPKSWKSYDVEDVSLGLQVCYHLVHVMHMVIHNYLIRKCKQVNRYRIVYKNGH